MPNPWTGKGNPYTRKEAVERLRAQLKHGHPIIAAGAGTGISAKFIEKGGADLIIIYNSGRFRMAGRGSTCGLMAYGDANAIAMEMQGVKPQRPMTHDLLKHLLAGLGGELRRVHITDLRDDTYFAELQIVRGEQVVQVDARPSDSIALALRCNAPIFTSESLLDRAAQPSSGTEPSADPEALKRYLEKLDPQDFGRFQP